MLPKSMMVMALAAILAVSGCSGVVRDIKTVHVIPKVNGHSLDSGGAWLGVPDGSLRGRSVGVDFRYPLGQSATQREAFIDGGFCFRNVGGQCVFQANDDGGSGLGWLWILTGLIGGGWLIYEIASGDCPLDDEITGLSYGAKDRYSKDGCKCEDVSRVPGYSGYACGPRH